jgi:hypothetical protein
MMAEGRKCQLSTHCVRVNRIGHPQEPGSVTVTPQSPVALRHSTAKSVLMSLFSGCCPQRSVITWPHLGHLNW